MSIRETISLFYSRAYFSRYRNLLTGQQLLTVGLTALITMLVITLLLPYYPALGSRSVSVPSCTAICIGAIYFFQGYTWSYKKTNMLLRADGRECWSIHMGAAVSFSSYLYARAQVGFMPAGVVTILRDGTSYGLTGIVILKSHLLADDSKRRQQILALQEALPHCTVSDLGAADTLGKYYARKLSKARNAYRKKHGKSPKPNFRPSDHVGAIEIRLRQSQ